MRRIYRWFTLLLPVILLAGACQPLLTPAARSPRLEVQGHVSGATLTVAVQGDYAYRNVNPGGPVRHNGDDSALSRRGVSKKGKQYAEQSNSHHGSATITLGRDTAHRL